MLADMERDRAEETWCLAALNVEDTARLRALRARRSTIQSVLRADLAGDSPPAPVDAIFAETFLQNAEGGEHAPEGAPPEEREDGVLAYFQNELGILAGTDGDEQAPPEGPLREIPARDIGCWKLGDESEGGAPPLGRAPGAPRARDGNWVRTYEHVWARAHRRAPPSAGRRRGLRAGHFAESEGE